MTLVVVVEGDTDLPVVRKLARAAGLEIASAIDCGGKGRLDEQLESYNAAARGSPWFVLRDLDTDADCAPSFLRARKLVLERWMCLRLAVREIEAWLLADDEAIARYFAVARADVPSGPDAIVDPTAALVALASRSKRRAISRAMVPPRGFRARVGPLYEAMIIEFGQLHWDLDRACARSPSLRRSRRALCDLAIRWNDATR